MSTEGDITQAQASPQRRDPRPFEHRHTVHVYFNDRHILMEMREKKIERSPAVVAICTLRTVLWR